MILLNAAIYHFRQAGCWKMYKRSCFFILRYHFGNIR